MTKIKLCGLFREEDIEAANQLMPDYIGFVFAKRGHRQVTPRQALSLRKRFAGGILAVGVFVREDPAVIAALLSDGVIDVAQLHGGETARDIDRLRALTDRPVFQAFPVSGEASLRAALLSPADMILLDSGAGGTGTAFDWSLLQSLQRPFLLAGGLDPENVGAAVRRLAPWGVDVSSGIETDRKKDPHKMKAFVEAVRRADGAVSV